jgi:hypothetical protein
MTPQKVDLYKLHKEEYAAPGKPKMVQIKKARYLTVSGKGAPGGDDYVEKIGALYAMAYTVKMTRKFGGEQDYVVCKLESQYWAEGQAFEDAAMDDWRWKLMIRTPDFVKKQELKKALAALKAKGKDKGADGVVLEDLSEGTCVQMLHVGPYDREGETVELMKEHAESSGYEFHGLHHDIYISDPRRVPPQRLKTIVRRPVKKR